MTTRPTGSQVREAIFAVLADRSGRIGVDPLVGWSVLDLYAGSGALGIEAISRGAERAVFVDRDAQAVGVIARNLQALGLGERGLVVRLLVDRFLDGARPAEPFDLVLADPPYALGVTDLLERLAAFGSVVSPGATIVLQHAAQEELGIRCGNLGRVWARTYGSTAVSIYAVGGGAG